MVEITKDTVLDDDLLIEFKKEYKKLYRTFLVDGTEIIWRPLKRPEFKDLMNKFKDIKDEKERIWRREEECCRMVVLYPCAEIFNDIVENMAGVASSLCDDIYEKSGFRMISRTSEV